jgi:hypothetical protein
LVCALRTNDKKELVIDENSPDILILLKSDSQLTAPSVGILHTMQEKHAWFVDEAAAR